MNENVPALFGRFVSVSFTVCGVLPPLPPPSSPPPPPLPSGATPLELPQPRARTRIEADIHRMAHLYPQAEGSFHGEVSLRRPGVYNGTVSRWQRYWFGDGGRTSVAVLRIAIATSVLLTLARLDNPVSTGSATLYRPVGMWMLLGHHAPPVTVVDLLWIVAWVSTGCMLIGLASRASAAVSCFTGIA